MNLIQKYVQEILDSLAAASTSSKITDKPSVDVPEEPDSLRLGKRVVKHCPPPVRTTEEYISIEETRQANFERLMAYSNEPDPGYVLLLRSAAGTGKTTAGARAAQDIAKATGKLVGFAGPRHNFYYDILEAAIEQGLDPSMWVEWLARQNNQDNPIFDTCKWAGQCNEFAAKGYPADTFCERICGRQYMNNGCRYHQQSKTTAELIYIQHQHLVSGHPLAKKFHMLIGDENPMGVFINDITIPAEEMHWKGVEYHDPIAEILNEMQRLARHGAKLSGYELLNALGMEKVLAACDGVDMERLMKTNIAKLRQPNDVKNAGYNILPQMLPILRREAIAALEQRQQMSDSDKKKKRIDSTFVERIYIDDGKLTVLARKHLAKSMPAHIAWFDGTGDPMIFERLYGRPVVVFEPKVKMAGKVYQVVGRNNSKSSLMQKVETGPEERAHHTIEYSENAHQLRAMIQRIVQKHNLQKPALIAAKALTEFLGADGYFYGNRGTNAHQKCDGIIVAGTPNVPRPQVLRQAKCIWQDEMKPFDDKWITVDRPYNYVGPDGMGRSMEINQYADPRLNAVLRQQREAEIIQSANRARIIFRDVPVYLMTSLPIDELPPTELITMRELMETPEDVHIFKWAEFIAFITARDEEKGLVTLGEIVNEFGLDKATAIKYMDKLEEAGTWMPIKAWTQSGKGRPPRAITKI